MFCLSDTPLCVLAIPVTVDLNYSGGTPNRQPRDSESSSDVYIDDPGAFIALDNV